MKYEDHDDFKTLQYAAFPQLQILIFDVDFLNQEYLNNFLEINGKGLIEIYFYYDSKNLINLAIAKFCPNLKSLYTKFKHDEVETLKVILISCQQLESMVMII